MSGVGVAKKGGISFRGRPVRKYCDVIGMCIDGTCNARYANQRKCTYRIKPYTLGDVEDKELAIEFVKRGFCAVCGNRFHIDTFYRETDMIGEGTCDSDSLSSEEENHLRFT